MHGIEPGQGFPGDIASPPEELQDAGTDKGKPAYNFRSHSGSPICVLIPGQQVAGETEGQGGDEQQAACYPGYFAGFHVRVFEVHHNHMKQYGKNH